MALWSPGRALRGWALSPDEAHLAWWEGVEGETVVHCAELASGREVMTVRGRFTLGALAWSNPETLWLVHWQASGEARVVAHAVPDGGALGAVKLPHVASNRYRVTLAHGGALALVAPWRWNAAGREAARLRQGYILRGEGLEVLGAFDPDAVRGLAPSGGARRQAVAALSPDGSRVAVAYGGSPEAPSKVALVDWRTLTATWLEGRVSTAAEDVRWVDPKTVAVVGRGAPGSACEGELVVASDRADWGEPFESWRDGYVTRVGPEATADLAPDRGRLLVHGSAPPSASAKRPRRAGVAWWLDLETRDVSGVIPCGEDLELASGAVFPGSGEDWLVLLKGGRSPRVTLEAWTEVPDPEGFPGAGVRVAHTLDGVKPKRARLSRSPAGRWYPLQWEVDEPRGNLRLAMVPSLALDGSSA